MNSMKMSEGLPLLIGFCKSECRSESKAHRRRNIKSKVKTEMKPLNGKEKHEELANECLLQWR